MFEIWSSDPGLYGNIPTVILYCYTLGFTRKYVYFFGLKFRPDKTDINFYIFSTAKTNEAEAPVETKQELKDYSSSAPRDVKINVQRRY